MLPSKHGAHMHDDDPTVDLRLVRARLLLIRDQMQPTIPDIGDPRLSHASANAAALALSIQDAINNINLAIRLQATALGGADTGDEP